MGYTTIEQFVCTDQRGKFKKVSKEVKELGPHELLLKTLACGVCHTDCALLKEGVVCGHEPVGRVVAAGSEVEKFKVGDVVCTSFLRSACLDCRECNSGQDVMCQKRVIFPEGNMNGFASHQVCDSRFAYKLPEGMEPKDATVMMCAGITVFQALHGSKIPPTGRVAIVGIGGLGHLALQFSKYWGCHVTAISHSSNKKEEAFGFGAHDFLTSKDFTPEYIAKLDKKYDLILDTVSVSLDWDIYLSLLNRNGSLYMIGVPDSPIEIKNPVPLLVEQKTLKGSLVGGRYALDLMLEFVQRHNIKAKIEEYPFDLEGLETAIERCDKGQARYRAVLIARDQK